MEAYYVRTFFLSRKLQLFLTFINAIASRMRWRLLESNSIAKPEISIVAIRLIRREWVL